MPDNTEDYKEGYNAARFDSIITKLDELARKFDSFTTEIIRRVTNIEIIQESRKAFITECENTKIDHENRLRGLENSDRKWAVASVIISAAIAVMLKYLL
jgi:hypothetical protein